MKKKIQKKKEKPTLKKEIAITQELSFL